MSQRCWMVLIGFAFFGVPLILQMLHGQPEWWIGAIWLAFMALVLHLSDKHQDQRREIADLRQVNRSLKAARLSELETDGQ